MGKKICIKYCVLTELYTTSTPSIITYLSVVSCYSISITLTIVSLSCLYIFSCNIQNDYITAPWNENIWTIAGPLFRSYPRNNMLTVQGLYGLKFSGVAFRGFLEETFYDLG